MEFEGLHMHVVDDLEQRRAMLAGMQAWNSDHHFLYIDVNGTALLPVEAENQGKVVITTEMGGSENVTAAVHRQTQRGLRNVLTHFGVFAGELVPRPRRTAPTLTPRAVVRRLHEIWNTGDVAAVDEVYAEDFVGHFPPSSHLPERRGRAGAREGIERARAAFPDWHEAIEAVVAEGNTVVTRYTSTGTHRGHFRGIPPTGRRIILPEISIYRVARGTVVEQWCVLDDLGRLQQLGAMPGHS